MKEVEQDNADVICLEEVDKYEQYYKDQLAALGYECNLVWKTYGGYQEIEAVLIGWKKDRFTLVEAREI